MSVAGSGVSNFLKSLERWVELQRSILESFRSIDDSVREADRLEIIIHTRIAFNHMIKTLKAFDDWLQDPFIVSNIPREELVKVWDATMEMLNILLELDIEHTTNVKNLIDQAVREGRIDPVILHLKDVARGEDRRGQDTGMSI